MGNDAIKSGPRERERIIAEMPCVVIYERRKRVWRPFEALLWSEAVRILDWSDTHSALIDSAYATGDSGTIRRKGNKVALSKRLGRSAAFVAEPLVACDGAWRARDLQSLGYKPLRRLTNWPKSQLDFIESESLYCSVCDDFLPSDHEDFPCDHAWYCHCSGGFVGPGIEHGEKCTCGADCKECDCFARFSGISSPLEGDVFEIAQTIAARSKRPAQQ